jgi:hypothetical protein
MRKQSHPKPKNKTASLHDFKALILLEWSVVLLLVVFLLFQIAALAVFNSM